MDKKQFEQEIIALDSAISDAPTDSDLYFLRGRLNYRMGEMHSALNDFIRAYETDSRNFAAREYIEMISEIFEFHYKDIYNP